MADQRMKRLMCKRISDGSPVEVGYEDLMEEPLIEWCASRFTFDGKTVYSRLTLEQAASALDTNQLRWTMDLATLWSHGIDIADYEEIE